MNDTSTNITTKTLDKATIVAGLLTVSQACRRYPGARGNASLNPSTMTRWIHSGCPSRDGRLIKLKATRCGSRWLIDPADLTAFFEQLAGVPPSVPETPAPRSDKQRRAACARAIEELEKRGA
jgi:hypothetical protein